MLKLNFRVTGLEYPTIVNDNEKNHDYKDGTW